MVRLKEIMKTQKFMKFTKFQFLMVRLKACNTD